MGRVLTYVLLFPFLVGLPFLGLGLTGPFWKYVFDVYALMIIPALFLAAIDFLLSKYLRWQALPVRLVGPSQPSWRSISAWTRSTLRQTCSLG